MPDGVPTGDASMSPEDALRTMASVTSHTKGLRVRTEGLTIVVFALCMMASYLTILAPILMGDAGGAGGGARPGPGGARGPPPSSFLLHQFAPLAWYVIAVVVTLAIWRSASLSFQTGMSTPRLLAVFVGWMLIFVTLVVLLTTVQGGNPRSWHLVAWSVVIGLFALLNPLRFTRQGRVATGVMAGVALATALYAFAADLGGREVGSLSGLALGIPGLVAGLWLMFRG